MNIDFSNRMIESAMAESYWSVRLCRLPSVTSLCLCACVCVWLSLLATATIREARLPAYGEGRPEEKYKNTLVPSLVGAPGDPACRGRARVRQSVRTASRLPDRERGSENKKGSTAEGWDSVQGARALRGGSGNRYSGHGAGIAGSVSAAGAL